MGLEVIRGQDRALRTLGQAFAQGRFHHAYRFEGPDGIGKELTAMCLARVLNCTDRKEHEVRADAGQQAVRLPDFCGHCRDCRKIAGGMHPDVQLVAAEKGKASISIAQVRELHGWVIYPPSEGQAKVVVVRDADRITEEAANAFLKMLEEPPSRTHFFLITSRPHNMLTTISSRSVPVRFTPLAPADLEAVLGSILAGDERLERVGEVISLSGGSVSSAMMHLSEQYGEVMEAVVRLDRAYATGVHALGEVLDDITVTRESVGTLLTFLEMFYRDVAWVGVTGGEAEGLMLRPVESSIRDRARSLGPREASAMALRIPEHRSLLEGYVNPRMVLERLYGELSRESV